MKLMHRIPTLFAICSLFFTLTWTSTQAQCPSNIGFELNNFNQWTGYTGSCCPIAVPTVGIVAGQHTIMTGPGVDPNVGVAIPVVAPGGGTYSVRLGNDQAGRGAERLAIDVPITPQNTSFVYRYAVVLQDPGHSPADQPRFDINIKDALGNTVPCGLYQVTAGGNIPGFVSAGQLRL